MVTIGIDPGLSGAIAAIGPAGLRGAWDMPVMPIPGVGDKTMVKTKVDAQELLQLIRRAVMPGEVARVALERVQAMTGHDNSMQSQAALMRSLGTIEAVCECMRVPVTYVSPQTWKGWYGLIDAKLTTAERKERARQRALALWPGMNAFARKKDHGRAEAALLAQWLLRTTE